MLKSRSYTSLCCVSEKEKGVTTPTYVKGEFLMRNCEREALAQYVTRFRAFTFQMTTIYCVIDPTDA